MLYIINDASLLPLNTFGINGSARYLVVANSADDINRLLNDPAFKNIIDAGLKPIGQGSNLLFTDSYFDGSLLKYDSTAINIIDDGADYVVLSVDAGIALDALIEQCCQKGWWGLENLSLIPGTVGAAAVQNVGAYGVEFCECVSAVNCYDLQSNRLKCFDATELAYAYRDSIFKHAPVKGRYLILSVTIRLSKTPRQRLSYGNLAGLGEGCHIEDIRKTITTMRQDKLPEVGVVGSAGSFFKNPILSARQFDIVVSTAGQNAIDTSAMPAFKVDGMVKLSAAWLIDKAGWKGFEDHHAAVWSKQPLVLVNADGRASGRDIAKLAERIIDDIKLKFGVELEPEVEYL